MEYEKAKKQGLAVIMCLFLAILVISFAQWYRVLVVNDRQEVILPDDTSGKIAITMGNTAGATDKWQREIPAYDYPEELKTYTGATLQCVFENKLHYDVVDWTVKMTMHEECYFNGFWGGTMEIHQFRNGEELVDAIDSNTPDLATLKLEHNSYADALLIHMLPGDYIVYIPAESVEKDFNRNEKTVSLIMNWYFEDSVSLEDYEFHYSNNMKMTDGNYSTVIIVLFILWVVILAVYIAMIIVYKQTKKGMEHHYNGISMMAGIYDFVCYFNLENDTYHLIKNNKTVKVLESNGKGIQAYFKKCLLSYCDPSYQKIVEKFLDVSTMKERIENRTNLVCEYKKAEAGWGVLRIIYGKETSKSVLLVEEDITEKKENVMQTQEYLEQSEADKKLKGDFLQNLSFSLEQLVGNVLSSNGELKNMIKDPEILNCVEKIDISTQHLQLLQNSILDMFAIDCGEFVLQESPYSIKKAIDEVSHVLMPFYINAPYEYIVDMDPSIQDTVFGDARRLKQVLVLLLFSPLVATKEGSVKLIVYGKQKEGIQELIFSIRDTGDGIPQEFLALLKQNLEQPRITFMENAGFAFTKLIDILLKEMGSKLNIVSVESDGTEMYFTLRQAVVESATDTK